MSAEKHLSQEEVREYTDNIAGAVAIGDSELVNNILTPLCEENKRKILNTSTDQTPTSVLHISITNNHMDIMGVLLEAGANPNQVYDFKKVHGVRARFEMCGTPINQAISCRNEEAILLLIKAGANLDIKGPKGKTLEEYIEATFKKEPDVVTKIVEAIDNERGGYIKGESSEIINHHRQSSNSAVERLAYESSSQDRNSSPSM